VDDTSIELYMLACDKTVVIELPEDTADGYPMIIMNFSKHRAKLVMSDVDVNPTSCCTLFAAASPPIQTITGAYKRGAPTAVIRPSRGRLALCDEQVAAARPVPSRRGHHQLLDSNDQRPSSTPSPTSVVSPYTAYPTSATPPPTPTLAHSPATPAIVLKPLPASSSTGSIETGTRGNGGRGRATGRGRARGGRAAERLDTLTRWMRPGSGWSATEPLAAKADTNAEDSDDMAVDGTLIDHDTIAATLEADFEPPPSPSATV
jgi:hypothetical protein